MKFFLYEKHFSLLYIYQMLHICMYIHVFVSKQLDKNFWWMIILKQTFLNMYITEVEILIKFQTSV